MSIKQFFPLDDLGPIGPVRRPTAKQREREQKEMSSLIKKYHETHGRQTHIMNVKQAGR